MGWSPNSCGSGSLWREGGRLGSLKRKKGQKSEDITWWWVKFCACLGHMQSHIRLRSKDGGCQPCCLEKHQWHGTKGSTCRGLRPSLLVGVRTTLRWASLLRVKGKVDSCILGKILRCEHQLIPVFQFLCLHFICPMGGLDWESLLILTRCSYTARDMFD